MTYLFLPFLYQRLNGLGCDNDKNKFLNLKNKVLIRFLNFVALFFQLKSNFQAGKREGNPYILVPTTYSTEQFLFAFILSGKEHLAVQNDDADQQDQGEQEVVVHRDSFLRL